jgi:hypothetical protein
MTDHEPMTDVGCKDPELSQELRDALTTLRDHSDNDDFRALADDVLAGRCGLVEASGTAAFGNVVFASIAQEFANRAAGERRGLTAENEPAGDITGACGNLCAGCPGVCAVLRGHPGG